MKLNTPVPIALYRQRINSEGPVVETVVVYLAGHFVLCQGPSSVWREKRVDPAKLYSTLERSRYARVASRARGGGED